MKRIITIDPKKITKDTIEYEKPQWGFLPNEIKIFINGAPYTLERNMEAFNYETSEIIIKLSLKDFLNILIDRLKNKHKQELDELVNFKKEALKACLSKYDNIEKKIGLDNNE